ncbi:hypothetical protein ACTG9Q_22735 [Actinokineospora sp. 24-640]
MTVTDIAKAAVVTTFAAIALALGSGAATAATQAPAPTTGDAQVTSATNPWE